MKAQYIKYVALALAAIATFTVSATASTVWIHNPAVPAKLKK